MISLSRSLDDFVPGQRVWVWVDRNRDNEWTGVRVLADELSAHRFHGGGGEIQGWEVDMASEVVVRSVSGERFTQEIETGEHSLLADEPESHGGSNRGPGPYEYLLAALGT